MSKIDLNQQNLNEIRQILQHHVPNYPVLAFGSRVNGNAKTYSDLDLAIITQQPLSLSKIAQLKEAFDESNLPIRVDVVDWGATSEAFQKIILQNNVPMQKGFDSTKVANNIKTQRGAVLAFSLVMLLLLTLAATRMIQQNKQQLEMSNNARLLTQEFANAEGFLANAKSLVNGDTAGSGTMPQHIDPTGTPINNNAHQCVPLSSYKQNIGLAGVVNNSATILSASCLSSSGTTLCTAYVGTQLICYPKSAGASGVNCTGKSVDEIAALFTDPTDACYQPYDPTCSNPNGGSNPNITNSSNPDDNYNPNPRCRLAPPNPLPSPNCPKEVYKIQVISTSSNGTTREIISDHVVGCGT